MDIDNNISLKKFSFFIEVLNLSYEDFDFKYFYCHTPINDFYCYISFCKRFISPRHFKCLVSHGGDRKKDLLEIRNMVNSKLESVESVENGFLDKLWRDIDHFVPLQNCEIYSYNPPREEDNLIVENKLWDLNLFFFQKRHILFLSCVATVYRP
ncbi:RNA polymerase III-inhibiting protein maf1 [Bonamia ostreae]|uniref:RNA polymerase III-inhibiting protein maf1 n=1 Tax=Bonamia ostreae TaxID=126728 RepID=A0ABV2ATB6_9EUKA